MASLRSYQEEPVRKAIDFFKQESPAPALMVLPTAWGKSWLTAYVARSIDPDDHLLVIQPTKELLEQNYDKYISLCGELAEAGIYSASFGKKVIKKITYATIGSIKNLGEMFREYGFTKMLVDEAHLYPRKEESMIGQFLADSGITHVLGITATPLKLETVSSQKLVPKKDQNGSVITKNGKPVMMKVYDGYSKLVMLTNPSNDGSFFRDIIHIGQIQEMTRLGFWSALKYDIQPFDPHGLELNSSGSEFSEKSEATVYEKNDTRNRIRAALDYYRNRKHCLVFVPSVEEAETLASLYPNSACVSGNTPKKERQRVINGFRKGEIRVVFNVNVLSCGFDYTGIDCIVLGLSTASIARYYQILGRGVRIEDGKQDCLVVDFGGNVKRFGHIEDLSYEWEGIWRMYGTNGTLLSGIPIECLGCFNRDDVYRMTHNSYGRYEVMPFGKYKGWALSDTPLSYLRWYVRKINDDPEERESELSTRIRIRLENDIRDTRNEPPILIMPTGIHQEKLLSEIPKNYLTWMYRNTKWTPMNDSLRRGIELALGNGVLFEYYYK